MINLVADEKNVFGEWLEKQLLDKKISQVELARRIHISREQVRRILKGESGTKRETVEDIALAIGARPQDVLRIWLEGIEPEPRRGVLITPDGVFTHDGDGQTINVPMTPEEFAAYQKFAPIIAEIVDLGRGKRPRLEEEGHDENP